MRDFLSPKELALAVGASESSLKRWTDSGLVTATRTAGGHRRIPLAEAVRFIREHRVPIVRPDILGLGDLSAVEGVATQEGPIAERLYEAISEDRAQFARGLLISLYLGGMPVSAIADGPVRDVMHRIGEMWKHGEGGIAVEHRGTDTFLQALNQIRSLLPAPADDAPVALGGAPSGDPYLIPSLLASTVLAEVGFKDHNLGPETPLDAYLWAINHYKPRVVWLAVSTPIDSGKLRQYVQAVLDAAHTCNAAIVVGGRAVESSPLPSSPLLQHVRSMSELVAFTRGMLSSVRPQADGVSHSPSNGRTLKPRRLRSLHN